MVEIKKNPKADLSKTSGMFLNFGLVVSLLLCLVAFEWKSYDDSAQLGLKGSNEQFEEMLEVPVTVLPPPKVQVIIQPEIIEVPDEQEIEQDIELDLDVEMNESTVIENVVFKDVVVEEDVDEVFTIVEDQPTPEGGMAAFYEFVSKNMKYPAQARRMGIEGKVFVQFVVDRDGKLNEVTAVRGIGAGCDEEAVRVISEAPRWKPGKQRGRAVKVRMILPITFKLG